jgi:hypothetical protein
MSLNLTLQELMYIRNGLLAKAAYRYTEIPHGVKLWGKFEEDLFDKINREFHNPTDDKD